MGAEGCELPPEITGNSAALAAGGAKSGAVDGESQMAAGGSAGNLAAALAMIAGLPLSEAEKAQAVRQLLAGQARAGEGQR